ncbi:unnamed protein product, partial [Mesorhabditis belari]|uniref:UDP-xylose and UDP-N-acetylglucosamine transporter n=1 Tax=Mesorhabditis belari TaxID=2138241 RepID=A0AAF3FN56_9BILA
MSAAFDVFGVLGSCMGCMVAVEGIAKEDPSAMNLMTFATFVTISLVGLVTTKKFFTVPNKIPFRGYLWVITIFFTVNVINNQALNFHIPVPLHIIFRSGSLLASLLLEVAWRGRRYGTRKYLSVFAITIGIIICTLATSSSDPSGLSYEEASQHYREWTIGISMLVFALFASAFLAIKQQEMYQTYGKHPDEAMFVTHFYSLPFFAFMWSDIQRSITAFNASAPFSFGDFSLNIPKFWVLLGIACILQYLCIRFVYNLNATVEALTVTLVVTLRKFLSLIVSIVLYENPFTPMHWFGAALVFGGTACFDDAFFKKEEKKKKQ